MCLALCLAKYRRVVFDEDVDQELRAICLEIAKRYEIEFLEIGNDRDHVHFLMQSVPSYSPTKIVRSAGESHGAGNVQANTAREGKALGRRVLVKGLFHQHSRTTR